MGVDADPAFGSFPQYVLEMIDAKLAVMPLVMRDAILINTLQLPAVGDVAGLDLPHTQRLIKIVGGRHLRLVIADLPGRFVVPDQPHLPVTCIVRYSRQVEVIVSLGEIEDAAIVEPVTVPAEIPALDENTVKAMVSRKIDMRFGVFGGRAVFLAGAPCFLVEVHRPPDTNVLARLDPGDVAKFVRLVQIENQA